LRAGLRWTYSHADRVVSVSPGVGDELCARFGVDPRKQIVIANPVDVCAISCQAGQALSHAWTAPQAAPLLLAVGKLSPQKDFPTLLRAFARVRRDHDARLVILGEGTERGRLERLVQELRLEDTVSMPGFVSNPHAWMARASVFVLSSRWEGFSNVLAEALACGCPVVSTDCPSGPAELLDGGRLGRLVIPGDALALATAIVDVLSVPPPRSALRARAAEFGIDLATDRYLAVLDEAARECSGTRVASVRDRPA
jgi:glycosyltransferase involved in cell wall biosynthesis